MFKRLNLIIAISLILIIILSAFGWDRRNNGAGEPIGPATSTLQAAGEITDNGARSQVTQVSLVSTLEALPTRTQKAVKNLTRQVEKQAADLERLRKRAIKTAETRRKRIASDIEARATKAGQTVVQSLNLASRSDVDLLSRRLAQLERRVKVKSARKTLTKAAA